jgi:hypothetical protein
VRAKLTIIHPDAALDRLLDALAHELTYVSDDEILEAAKELGMNPLMKGSAAFLGLRVSPIADLAEWGEFFASEQFRSALAKPRRSKRPPATQRKH